MYQAERMNAILQYLNANKRISVEEICNIYNVSRDTARRDLVNLETRGLIARTHGGAILPTSHEEIKDYHSRLHFSSEEKKIIGRLAASLIKDNDSIIMDASTTIQACVEFLQVKKCSIITNSINLADLLAEKPQINIHLLGGQLNHEHRFLYGGSTLNMLSNYFADKAFIGAYGITEKGLTIGDEDDAAVVRKMIEQSNEVIVLADHTKFCNNGFIKIVDLNKIDLIITDKAPDKKLIKIFDENKINLIIADNQ